MKRSRRHALGQHFLVNRSLLEKIVRTIAPEAADSIVEIGAGRGALTFLLAGKAGHVTAIEKDSSLVPVLREKEGERLAIVEADVLDLDLGALVRKAGYPEGHVKLVGNLPYSVSSPILFKALESRHLFSKCVFLIQKEVAERVCGKPGSKAYAPISILLQNAFDVAIEFGVSPGSFSPPPKVDSSVISLTRRPVPLHPVENEAGFRVLLRSAFAHRRKRLARNLEMGGFERPRIEEAFAALGISGNARAEEIPIGRFADLFRALRGTASPS
jgi:16S rRNA (adenine1518-N6/adenine1519-N6)-dimethyltransferase